jgi:hypothetical protein
MYERDFVARYLASRVILYNEDEKNGVPVELRRGISYETAIASPKTTKEAIDYWLDILQPKDENIN